MMSLEQIEYENKKAENRVHKDKSKLFIAQTNGDMNVKTALYIKDYKPKGWQQTEVFFVDSSGMGAQIEMALTFKQFITHVKKGCGYAIISQGQFQVYIAEFKEE